MKNLKQILLGAAFASATIIFTLSSCSEDNCEDVVCQNGGICNDGICDCAAGFKGTNCETLLNEKFRGTYRFYDVDNNNTLYTGELDITPTAADPLAMNIRNFGGFSETESLTVQQNTDDEYQFYMETPYHYNGVTISDVNGHINTALDTITVSYSAKDSTNPITTNNGIWVRQ